MNIKNLSNLGAKRFSEGTNREFDIKKVESDIGIEFPDSYASILEHFGESIVFEKGAKYKPCERSPVDSVDGFQSLEMLYGLDGDYNLIEMNKRYRNQIPSRMVVIGDSVGGNQICVSLTGENVYFWHHEALTEDSSLYKISDSIGEFLGMLVPDEESGGGREIDESESFLDF